MNGLNPRDDHSSQACGEPESKQAPPKPSTKNSLPPTELDETNPNQTIELKKLLLSITNKKQKAKLKDLVNGNIDFLPDSLRNHSRYRVSSNPLRHEEPLIEGVYNCKSFPNNSPERLLLSIGVVLENIDMLSDVLFVISYGNDYSKKLIGKYIILELNTIYYLLQKFCDHDQHYESALFPQLKSRIKELEEKHGIVFLKRNLVGRYDPNLQIIESCQTWSKISRLHIGLYLDLFEEHLNLLLPRYSHRIKFYFNTEIQFDQEAGEGETSDHYQPFDLRSKKQKKTRKYVWQTMKRLEEQLIEP